MRARRHAWIAAIVSAWVTQASAQPGRPTLERLWHGLAARSVAAWLRDAHGAQPGAAGEPLVVEQIQLASGTCRAYAWAAQSLLAVCTGRDADGARPELVLAVYDRSTGAISDAQLFVSKEDAPRFELAHLHAADAWDVRVTTDDSGTGTFQSTLQVFTTRDGKLHELLALPLVREEFGKSFGGGPSGAHKDVWGAKLSRRIESAERRLRLPVDAGEVIEVTRVRWAPLDADHDDRAEAIALDETTSIEQAGHVLFTAGRKQRSLHFIPSTLRYE